MDELGSRRRHEVDRLSATERQSPHARHDDRGLRLHGYAYLVIYTAPAFFPRGDPATSILASLAVFAVGFISRHSEVSSLAE